jgi:hypothetical protein
MSLLRRVKAVHWGQSLDRPIRQIDHQARLPADPKSLVFLIIPGRDHPLHGVVI